MQHNIRSKTRKPKKEIIYIHNYLALSAFTRDATLLGSDNGSNTCRNWWGRINFPVHLLSLWLVFLPPQSIFSFRHSQPERERESWSWTQLLRESAVYAFRMTLFAIPSWFALCSVRGKIVILLLYKVF